MKFKGEFKMAERKQGSPTLAKTTRDLHLKRKAMWDASMSNHKQYLDESSGYFLDKFLEARSCPACGSSDERVLFRKSGGVYVACNKCAMVYLNPVFKDEILEHHYRNNHELQGEAVSSDIDFYSQIYLKGLGIISSCVPEGKNILDVGCSTGIFLDIARDKGWQTFGLELNEKESSISRQKGHIIKEDMIESVCFGEKFSAITLWDVFEHIKDGHRFLNQAKRLLLKDGVIFIQSPSRDSLAARIMQSSCNMFDGLEHVNLYGYESLSMVAASAGYRIDSFETVISEIGVMNNYVDYFDPYLGFSTNRESFVGLISENDIHEKRLGYKFQACLRLI